MVNTPLKSKRLAMSEELRTAIGADGVFHLRSLPAYGAVVMSTRPGMWGTSGRQD